MKNIKILLILILPILLLTSCKSNVKKETPEDVTKKFVTAFYMGDFNDMYKYSMSSNKVIVQQLEKSTTESDRDRMKKQVVEFQKVNAKLQNDSVAECNCYYTIDGNQRNTLIYLRMEDGKWLVDMKIN